MFCGALPHAEHAGAGLTGNVIPALTSLIPRPPTPTGLDIYLPGSVNLTQSVRPAFFGQVNKARSDILISEFTIAIVLAV